MRHAISGGFVNRPSTITAADPALTAALAAPVTAQGVPTVDTQNIAQEIRQLQQMLQDFRSRPIFWTMRWRNSNLLRSSSTSSRRCMHRLRPDRAASSASRWAAISTASCRPISKTSLV